MKSLIPTLLALGILAPTGAAFAQCADISINPVTLPNGQQGVTYSPTLFTATGAGGEPVWSITPVPQGFEFSGNGSLSGTPGAAGTFPLRVTVTSSSGCVAGQFVTLTVAPGASTAPVPTITIARTTTSEPTPQPLIGTMNITDSNDAGAATFSAIIAVDAGNLTVGVGSAAVTLTGNETDAVTLTGTLADINAVLAGSSGATVNYGGDGTLFADVTLTLTANDGTETGTATSIMSGPTVVAPRVIVVPPGTTRQLAVSSLNAAGGTVDGSPYGYLSSVPGTVAVNATGQLTTNTTLNAAQITVTSTGRRPAGPWVAVNNVVPVTVGANIAASITASDGFSAFGSNLLLPSTNYYADIYTIALAAGQTVTIKADSGDDLDTYMILADANGYVLASNDDDDNGDLGVGSRIDFTAPAAGTYVIEQSTFNGLDTGSYTFTVQSGAPRPRATAPKPLLHSVRVKR